jgi:hypothetical protein
MGDKNSISTVIHTAQVLLKKKVGVTMRYRCPHVGGCLCLDQGEISRCMWFQSQRFKTTCDSLRFCVKVLLPHWHRGPQNLKHYYVHHSTDQFGDDVPILPLSRRVLNSILSGSNKLVLPDQRRSGRSQHRHVYCTIFKNGSTKEQLKLLPSSLIFHLVPSVQSAIPFWTLGDFLRMTVQM